jgi:hypothetical protein
VSGTIQNRQALFAYLLASIGVCAAGLSGPAIVRGQSDQPLAIIEKSPDEESRLVEGLLSRRLFKLARQYAAQQIVDPDLSPRGQAELAAELVRTYALEASHAPPDRRDSLWQAATKVPVTFEQQFPDNRFVLLPQVQAAIAVLAQGKLARQEGEILEDEQLTLQARAALRGALQRLDTLQAAILLAFGREIHVLRRSLAPWLKSDGARLAAASPDVLTATALVGDPSVRRLRVELLADLDAAAHAPLPPPLGLDAGEVLLH